MKRLMFFGFLTLFSHLFCQAEALSLDEFLSAVALKHHLILANEKSKEAAAFKRIGGDSNLSPLLSLSAGYLDDQKMSMMMPGFFMIHNTSWVYSAGLAKNFETGTQAALNMNLSQSSLTLDNMATGVPQYTSFGSATVAFGLSVSQSLWKDFFGHGTRLRQDRERKTEELTKENFNLQTKQILIEAELAFWDLLYLQEEQKLRQDSLARAKKIETWVKNRFSNGIGDKSDVLNAEGLAAVRELQLIQNQDDIVANRRKVMDMMELQNPNETPKMDGELSQARHLEALATGSEKGRRVRLDSYLTVLESKTKAIGSEEAAEAMKPDLVLSGGYSTNSFDLNNGISGAYSNIYQANTPTMSVGLKFTWLLDSDLKNANREAARRDSLASVMKMERQLLESDSAWQELSRRHHELTREVAAAHIVADVQNRKAAAERQKLEKGRTITLQVITAEQDAAESELTLARLQAAQRKMESQARMFVTLEETK